MFIPCYNKPILGLGGTQHGNAELFGNDHRDVGNIKKIKTDVAATRTADNTNGIDDKVVWSI